MTTNRSLAESIAEAGRTVEGEAVLQSVRPDGPRANELLFFFKPEAFTTEAAGTATSLVELGLDTLARFGVEVSGIVVVSGSTLERFGIMDRHYGYINQLSRRASEIVTGADREAIAHQLGLPSGDFVLLGGHEALRSFSAFDEQSLESFWASERSLRLRSGFYFQSYQIEGSQVVLVNGFHPAQLRHFTDPGHRIALMLLHSDAAWTTLRGEMIGDTFPERAVEGSLRREILARRDPWRLADVSIANNFCHLSAGPFEAFLELHNFFSPISSLAFELRATSVYSRLAERGLTDSQIRAALTNPALRLPAVNRDLFSATEGMDTTEALGLYRSHLEAEASEG